MQAITIAIGKNGITFFARQYLVGHVLSLLNGLQPPNRDISVPDFGWIESPDSQWGYSNVNIALTNGSLSGFSPAFQSIVQGVLPNTTTPAFTLSFQADNFSANYNWGETFHYEHQYYTWVGRMRQSHHSSGNTANNLGYAPGFGSLEVVMVIQFAYNASANAWQITVSSTNAQVSNPQANIPANSILQHQDNSCFESHVDDATAQAITNIDFGSQVNTLISGIIGTIPGSGKLGNGIVYDFSVGDSGLLFPDNDGIQMGVKGGASYQGEVFSESPAPSLPLPAPLSDTDTHHLNMYVSSYEVDALYWGYFKAGLLNLVINPQDLPNPAALDVSSYVGWEPALQPYANYVMQAQVTQKSAPVTSFQVTYVFGKTQMALLQSQLPADIYQRIGALPSHAYLSQQDLENFLKSVNVPQSYFTAIENVGKISALVVTQDMIFNLVIQAGESDNPYIQFEMQRVDVMTDLALGVASNNLQTMQFGFANASNTATYIGSTVPGFQGGQDFGGPLWTVTGESLYAANLISLGQNGVPLPIMQGFQFDFDKAVLSIQEGYVSILANVLYKS